MPAILIRSFQAGDREAVRTICCDSADRGEPIERIFFDRPWAADLLSLYYTDYEPSSIFVAQISGRVVGYILGCLDNRRYGLVMMWLVGPRLVLSGLVRGVFFQESFWQIVKGACRNWKRLFHWRKKFFHSHQGHMHIGIDKSSRGLGVGTQLVEALLKHAQTQGIEELAASVHSKNTSACHFFEQAGFSIKDRYPMVESRGDRLEEYTSVLYVKNVH